DVARAPRHRARDRVQIGEDVGDRLAVFVVEQVVQLVSDLVDLGDDLRRALLQRRPDRGFRRDRGVGLAGGVWQDRRRLAAADDLDVGAAGQALARNRRGCVAVDIEVRTDLEPGNDTPGIIRIELQALDPTDLDAVVTHRGALPEPRDRTGE